MPTVHLGVAGGTDLSNSIASLGQQLDGLTAKQRASAAATRTATAATSSLTSTAQQGIQRIQGMASSVQGLVSALGSDSRAAGLVGSLAGTVAQGVAFGTTFGPGGAVVGGVAAAVTSIASLAAGANEARDAIEAMNRATVDSMREVSHAIGDESGESWSGAMAAAQAQLVTLRARAEELRETAGSTMRGIFDEMGVASARIELGRVEDQIESLQASISRLSETAEAGPISTSGATAGGAGTGLSSFLTLDTALGRSGSSAPRRTGGGSRRDDGAAGGRATAEAYDEHVRAVAAAEDEAYRLRVEGTNARLELEAAEAERLRTFWEEQDDLRAAHDRAVEEASLNQAKESADHHISLLNELGNANKEFATGTVSSLSEVIAAYRDLQAASLATGVEMRDSGRLMSRGMTAVGNQITDVVGGQMTNAFNSALGAWLDGSKSFVEAAEEMAKGVIKALVQESIVQGVTELARGIADLASYRYDSAALHFAAAAAWAVVGGVAGGIGAATGAFGGGGKGGEGASQKDMADRDRESQRDQVAGTTVINMYYGDLPVTQSDVARGTYRGLRRVQREGLIPAGALGVGR